MTASTKIAPVLIAVGLLAAACSSGSGDSTTSGSGGAAPPPSNSVPPKTSTSPTAGSGAPSAATLKSIVLKQSDLPTGWTGKPADPESAQDKDLDAQLAACVGTGNTGDQNQVNKVQSDDFSKGQVEVSSDAASYRSNSDVQAQLALLKNPKAQGCLNKLFKTEITSSLPSTATIKSIGIKLDTSDTGIDNLVGVANGKITVSAQGRTTSVYIGAGFFTGDRITGEVTFSSIGAPIQSSFANPIVKLVTERAANA